MKQNGISEGGVRPISGKGGDPRGGVWLGRDYKGVGYDCARSGKQCGLRLQRRFQSIYIADGRQCFLSDLPSCVG